MSVSLEKWSWPQWGHLVPAGMSSSADLSNQMLEPLSLSPDEVLKDYGADIFRLWVASTDYTQDMRISKEILKQLADAYLKIRNTARYMLGNLAGL